MKNAQQLLRFVITLTLMICLPVLPGCGESGSESDSKSTEIDEFSKQTAPLQICRVGGDIETITLAQATRRHHHHEGLCLCVLTGYQAIRYAVAELFAGEVPEANDFDIKVMGTMDGTWDVLELYTGRKSNRYQSREELNLKSFTFVAKRVSINKAIAFRLRTGLIPEKFFELKNQGITCSDPALKKVKRQAAINILSIEPSRCFESLDSSITLP